MIFVVWFWIVIMHIVLGNQEADYILQTNKVKFNQTMHYYIYAHPKVEYETAALYIWLLSYAFKGSTYIWQKKTVSIYASV